MRSVALGGGLGRVWVKQPGVVTKVKNPELAASIKLVLKVGRCHCNGACQSVASYP